MERVNQIRRILGLVFVILGLYLRGDAQIIWEKAETWKLYNVGDRGLAVPWDSLGRCKSYELNVDSMRYFLDSASVLSRDIQPVWMGAFIATCTLSGESRKVDISYYAGFFYDEKSKCYYQIAKAKRNSWLNYLNSSLIAIQ